MKRIPLLFLLAPLSAGAMTHYKDGSIMLDPQEVKNVESNFNEMQQTIEEAAEVIKKLLEENEALKKPGKCV